MSRRYPSNAHRSYNRIRLFIALAMVAFAVISFLGSRTYNPVTGKKIYVGITPQQEIALGLQAAPQMIAQHGGELPNPDAQNYLDDVGHRLVENSFASDHGWQFEFTLLNDPQTVNAFALPGGQVFMTTGLFDRLETEGQLAGVLSHEIVHVLARHGAQRIAKDNLTQGLLRAVVVADETQSAAQIAQVLGQLVNMQYGRDDELESDKLGVQIMAEASYDPRAMMGVMAILEGEGAGQGQPEFLSTHPNPENRIGRIEEAINALFPNGLPQGLTP